MQDVLFEVAMRSKIRTIINIFCVRPNLNNLYFWKLKCNKDYPAKTYLDFWSGPENYLMGNKPFCLNINTNYDIDCRYTVDPYVYEYTKMLRKLRYPNTKYVNNYNILEILKTPHINQFILLMWNADDGKVMYDDYAYETENQCYDKISDYQLKIRDDYFNAAIINLQHLSPCFIKYDVLKKRKGKYVEFLKCYQHSISLLY